MRPDYLCVISALSPSEGLVCLVVDDDAASAVANDMATEVKAAFELRLSKEDVEVAICDALERTRPGRGNLRDKWQPDGYLGIRREGRDEPADRCILFQKAVGGSVETIPVDGYQEEYGTWCWVIKEDLHSGKEVWIEEEHSVDFDPIHSFFCWRRPYLYIQAWISRTRSSCFADDFYKLVTDHRGLQFKQDPDVDYSCGVVPCIDYGGLEKTRFEHMQDALQFARTGSKQTGRAIVEGKRGEELWPALAHDFGAWMCISPDIWPTPRSIGPVSMRTVTLNGSETACSFFLILPSELVIAILCKSPVASLATLSAVSRSMRHLTLTLAHDVLSYHLHYGELQWLLPAPMVSGEVTRAENVAFLWYDRNEGEEAKQRRSSFDHPEFPLYDFTRACLGSSLSMKNRRRLWGIAKQYERLGRDSGVW